MIRPVSIFSKFTPIGDVVKTSKLERGNQIFQRFDLPIKFDEFTKSTDKLKTNIPEIFY